MTKDLVGVNGIDPARQGIDPLTLGSITLGHQRPIDRDVYRKIPTEKIDR